MSLNERLEQIGGCGDGNCKVYIRPGMHTNGGCRCLRHDPIRAERVISAYRSEVDRLTAQLAIAEARNEGWREAWNKRVAEDAEAAEHDRAELDSLRAQLAEREGIARELADALELECSHANPNWERCPTCAAQIDAALARFHAAEGEG